MLMPSSSAPCTRLAADNAPALASDIASDIATGAAPVRDLALLLQQMAPELHPGVYAFVSVAQETDAAVLQALQALGSFREAEGWSLIVPEQAAVQAGLPVLMRAAWISLRVHSDLQAVGLTAAFSSALAAANISCNVVAAAYHDHIFVPYEAAAAAMQVLHALTQTAVP